MTKSGELGPVYTTGKSYRARAEARQREYRKSVLQVGFGKYGHFLDADGAESGQNFITEDAFRAARERQEAGKGVDPRTFENMLSSQAMCFNIFAPLSRRLDLTKSVLGEFLPEIRKVNALHIEHTPAPDVFRDQSGRGGVDCDVLVEATLENGDGCIVVIETKFVEPEFSTCGFRKAGRSAKGQPICPSDVRVGDDRQLCLYASHKHYGYWQRTDEHDVLADDAIPAAGCPFAGSRWQLWVNHVLAHEEASRRDCQQAVFAVCTSSSNTTLLGNDGDVLEGYRSLARRPSSVRMIDLERLLEVIGRFAPTADQLWARGLAARYAAI